MRFNTICSVLVLLLLLAACIDIETSEKSVTGNKTETEPRDKYTLLREKMVDEQIRNRGIKDELVQRAMLNVPRHEFIPEKERGYAYADHPVPIGHGQTISQPYIVAFMSEIASLQPGERVLEIGTGSGYQAAVLYEMGMETYTVEIIPELAEMSDSTLHRLGYNVSVRSCDGYYGWPEHAPYDAIIVTAAAPSIPQPLIEQLADNGKLVIPLGSTNRFQTLTVVEKHNNTLDVRHVLGVMFVPMTGRIQES